MKTHTTHTHMHTHSQFGLALTSFQHNDHQEQDVLGHSPHLPVPNLMYYENSHVIKYSFTESSKWLHSVPFCKCCHH